MKLISCNGQLNYDADNNSIGDTINVDSRENNWHFVCPGIYNNLYKCCVQMRKTYKNRKNNHNIH